MFIGCIKTSQLSSRNFWLVTIDVCGLALFLWNTIRLLLAKADRFWAIASFSVKYFAVSEKLIVDNSLPIPLNTQQNHPGSKSWLENRFCRLNTFPAWRCRKWSTFHRQWSMSYIKITSMKIKLCMMDCSNVRPINTDYIFGHRAWVFVLIKEKL